MNPDAMNLAPKPGPARPRRRFARALAAIAALALPLAACGEASPPAPVGPPPLEGAKLGGPFELTNGSGEIVRWSDFDGQYRIVYFGFTNCPDICPTDVQRTMQGLRQFAGEYPEAADNIQPIFITVDPARDTPAKVEEFAAAFSDRLIGLTGTQEQVDAAARNFGVAFYLEEPEENGAYNVQHARYTTLFGPDGQPIAFLPSDEGADAVQAELAKWVR